MLRHPQGRFNSRDAQGINNYQLADSGKPVVNARGDILCNYCGIPSHSRIRCTIRMSDEENGIRREIHPNRGLIPSGNQVRRNAQAIVKLIRKRAHEVNEEQLKSKTKPSPNRTIDPQTKTTKIGKQRLNTHTKPTKQDSTNLMDLPTEIMLKIMQHLPFRDAIRLGRVNKRWWRITENTSLWKDVTLLNTTLSCDLVAIAIDRHATTLNIRGCTIQGNHIKKLKLGHDLQKGLSKLKFLGLQGYKGKTYWPLSSQPSPQNWTFWIYPFRIYPQTNTPIIGRMKQNNKLTAINLSNTGGQHEEMGGLVYYPFDIHRLKPMIDRCRHLTDIILFGSRLTHEAITYFCENAPPTLLRINIARERAYNNHIRALTSSCPHLQYLNISETSVAYQDIIDIILTWKKTMINLCLPHRLGFILTLRSRAPIPFQPLMSQFQTLIKEMGQLKYSNLTSEV